MELELDDKVYKKIKKLCAKGDKYIEENKYDNAIQYYEEALELVPEPKDIWEASTFIYAGLGDFHYMVDEEEVALDYLFEALKCPDGLGNPLINMRIGQCFSILGNIEKAREYLLQAYMMDPEIFEDEEDIFEIIEDDVYGVEELDEEDYQFDTTVNHVDEKIEKELDKLREVVDEYYNEEEYEKAISKCFEMWDMLPDGKYEYDESYYILTSILRLAIKLKSNEVMKEWMPKIFLLNSGRRDDGDSSFWAGVIEYELENYDKSFEYFEIANKEMEGIRFDESEKKI